jgi:hypothetical protein
MTGTRPSEPSTKDATSRRDRLAQRRSRHTRVTVAVLVVAVAGALGIGAYALNSSDGPLPPVGASSNSQGFGSQGSLVPRSAIEKAAPRPLDHAHPLQLWVGGDSLAGSFGPALGDQLGALGIVKTVVDFKVSSGLWSNDIRNWDQRATDQMAKYDPEAVVFIIGTNDTPVVNRVDANDDGVPDWEATYRMKVAKMMDLLVGGAKHRTVFWLGPPTLPDEGMNRGAVEMSRVMQDEAAKRAGDVVFLDTYRLFADGDGNWSRQITDEQGRTITARIGDGVHFTQSGAAYLARAVVSLLDTRWKLTKQADLLHPIGWNFTPGSIDAVPGYSSQPTSRYRSSGRGGSSGDGDSPTTVAPVASTTIYVTPTTVEVVATTVPVTAAPTTVVTEPPTTAPPPPPPTTTPSAP